MKILLRATLLFLIACPVAIKAQDQGPAPESGTPGCSEELFENAEALFRKRQWRSADLFKAERELKEVVRLCADTPGRYQAEEHLKIAQEELAEHNLQIALFYLESFYNNRKGGKLGALARLKNIVERYPQYSKLDLVLLLLGDNVANDKPDEAAIYYRRLIKDFPGSQCAAKASLGLNAVEVMKTQKGIWTEVVSPGKREPKKPCGCDGMRLK
jgi:tetratricopeptide (TPR) repeat protein